MGTDSGFDNYLFFTVISYNFENFINFDIVWLKLFLNFVMNHVLDDALDSLFILVVEHALS